MMTMYHRIDLVPILSVLVFLVSLRAQPGALLFGDENYDGELRGWGVILRVLALAAFQDFEHLWTIALYLLAYAWVSPPYGSRLGELLEVCVFTALAWYVRREQIFNLVSGLTRQASKDPSSSSSSSHPFTPRSAFIPRPNRHEEERGDSSQARATRRKSAGGARSKSPAPVLSMKKRAYTPAAAPHSISFEEEEAEQRTPQQASPPAAQETTPSSSARTQSKPLTALEELKEQKKREREQRVTDKQVELRSAGGSSASKRH